MLFHLTRTLPTRLAGLFFLSLIVACSAQADTTLLRMLDKISQADTPISHSQADMKARRYMSSLSDEQLEEVTLLLLDDSVGHTYQLVAQLHRRLDGQPLTPTLSQHLARAMTMHRTEALHYTALNNLAHLLQKQQERRTDKLTTSLLLAALPEASADTESAIVRVLGAVPDTSEDFDSVRPTLQEVLLHSDNLHSRQAVLRGFRTNTQLDQNSDWLRAAVLERALNEPDPQTRLQATSLLVELGVTALDAQRVSRNWAAALDQQPRRAIEQDQAQELANALAALHAAPYPAHVVNSWITLQALDHLQATQLRGELSRRQLARLHHIAATTPDQAQRKAIYTATFLPASTSVEQLLQIYSRADPAQRLRAGIELQVLFASQPVTPAQATQVTRLLLHDEAFLYAEAHELRATAAALLVLYSQQGASQEAVLIEALRLYPQDSVLGKQALRLAQEQGNLIRSVLSYAGDHTLPESYRQKLLAALTQEVTPAQDSPELEQFLRQLVTSDASQEVAQQASFALKALGHGRPLQSKLQDKKLQGLALIFAWLLMLALLITGIPVGFVLALTRQVGNKPVVVISIRVLLALLWLALCVIFAVALGAGLLGSLGHNYSPGPARVAQANLYAYLTTPAYLAFLLLLVMLKARPTKVLPVKAAG